MDRRLFLKTAALASGSLVLTPGVSEAAAKSKPIKDTWMGCLVDLTHCTGCRKCEWACAEENGRELPPIESYDDTSVFERFRRPSNDSYTVINKFTGRSEFPNNEIYVKAQCMHCNDPACLSACIVGAFSKEENGTVKYDPWKCMGCRYCMVACPFQIPTYEYFNALTPQVRKCTLCFEKISETGGITACAKICPVEAIYYGNRNELLKIAHEKIKFHPGKYVNHVYGEHEAGGTSWMYISSEPFEKLGFPKLGQESLTSYTEPIQHAIFKDFIPQAALFAFLGTIMYMFRPGRGSKNHEE